MQVDFSHKVTFDENSFSLKNNGNSLQIKMFPSKATRQGKQQTWRNIRRVFSIHAPNWKYWIETRNNTNRMCAERSRTVQCHCVSPVEDLERKREINKKGNRNIMCQIAGLSAAAWARLARFRWNAFCFSIKNWNSKHRYS